MRRRRRGSRYTWMPMLGTTINAAGEGAYQANFIRAFLKPNADSGSPPRSGTTPPSLVVQPLVPDYTEMEDPSHGTGMTLRDYTEGQDWFLRRIVGKIYASCQAIGTLPPVEAGVVWPAVMLSVGFFVARSADADNSIDLQDSEVDPQDVRNIRQPWLWRRTWVLGAGQTAPSSVSGIDFASIWPNTTEGFGSMAEGTHIDAKTLRRIRREQRLWVAISAVGVGLGADTAVSGIFTDQPNVSVWMDLRALGAMRKSNNKSVF